MDNHTLSIIISLVSLVVVGRVWWQLRLTSKQLASIKQQATIVQLAIGEVVSFGPHEYDNTNDVQLRQALAELKCDINSLAKCMNCVYINGSYRLATKRRADDYKSEVYDGSNQNNDHHGPI